MLPYRVAQNCSRIDALLFKIDAVVGDVDSQIQNVFANHVVLAGAGYIEIAIIETLSEYCKLRGDSRIARFAGKSVARNNSLNCEKIEKILDQFDKEWWPTLLDTTPPASREAVDSLKTLRDQIAHGKPNGTGYTTVKTYYTSAKRFVLDLSGIITPSS